jgi:hypothetical protein
MRTLIYRDNLFLHLIYYKFYKNRESLVTEVKYLKIKRNPQLDGGSVDTILASIGLIP